MNYNLCYPATLEHAEDGYTVTFRDVPGAISAGDTPLQALDEARDALALILDDILEEGDALPEPSQARKGEHLVSVPADVAGRVLLRFIRDKSGLKKADAARLAEMSRQSYGQMEERGRNLSLKKLNDVAEALGYEVVMSVRPRGEAADRLAEKSPYRMGRTLRVRKKRKRGSTGSLKKAAKPSRKTRH